MRCAAFDVETPNARNETNGMQCAYCSNRLDSEMGDDSMKSSDISSAQTKEEKSHALPVQASYGGGLTAALHSGLGIESPFTREIFLARQVIVGMRYQGGSDQLVKEMETGSRVTFVREPENRYDHKAIMALDSRGRKLGYIPRNDNTILAALMDAGKYLYGIFVQKPSNTDSYSGSTPPVLFVDLYMREFALPQDPEQIPRQGYQGSYAVIDFTLKEIHGSESKSAESFGPESKDTEPQGVEPKDMESQDTEFKEADVRNTDLQITDLFAIRVINGEERGVFAATIHDTENADDSKTAGEDDSREEYEKMIRDLQRFTGYLPVVIHDISGMKKTALENAWGIYCGKPFSNLLINIYHMAQNHLYELRDYSLDSISRRLGIEASCENPQENNSRRIWRIYCRFDRSELDKKKDVIS